MSIGIIAFTVSRNQSTISPVILLLIYGLIYTIGAQFPGATLRVTSSEAYPTKLRGPANGINEGVNRFAAFISSFIFVNLLNTYGFYITMIALGVITGIGALMAIWVKETKLKSLEQASNEKIVIEEKGLS